MYARRFSHDGAGNSEWDGFLSALRAWLSVDHNEDGTHHVPTLPEAIPVGAMVMWGSNTPPEGWLICDGSPVSRTVYQGLFTILGTTYGAGDGSTTFNLPNLERRVPLGKAASGSASTLGSTGGSFDHTHAFSGGTTGANGGFTTSTGAGGAHSHTTGGPDSNVGIATTGGGTFFSLINHVHTTDAAADHTHSVSVGDHTHSLGAGSTDAGNQAYLVVNFIILAGV